jgi:hypothetical protein
MSLTSCVINPMHIQHVRPNYYRSKGLRIILINDWRQFLLPCTFKFFLISTFWWFFIVLSMSMSLCFNFMSRNNLNILDLLNLKKNCYYVFYWKRNKQVCYTYNCQHVWPRLIFCWTQNVHLMYVMGCHVAWHVSLTRENKMKNKIMPISRMFFFFIINVSWWRYLVIMILWLTNIKKS